MHFIHDVNIKMPSENCGLCGNPTCRIAAMAIFKGRMDPVDCPFLVNEKKNVLDEIYKFIDEGISADLVETKVGFESISPCPSDPAKLMFVYYPEKIENLTFNLYDERLMKTLLDSESIYISRSSPDLGFSRIENENGEYIIVFARGKFITRQALSETSGKRFLQNIANLVWLSKTSCETGYTIMDGIQGSCDCKTTVRSIEKGPENILLKENEFIPSSTEKPSSFFEQLGRSISENITSNNVNKYLQVCSINVREHIDQLALSESKNDAIVKARLVSKWMALDDLIGMTSSKYSGRESMKMLSILLKNITDRDINSVENLLSESKGYSWPKNFLMSKMGINAKRYLSVQL